MARLSLPSPSWRLLFLVTLSLSVLPPCGSQRTRMDSGCTFLDEHSVYNIEVVRGQHQLPCPSLQGLENEFAESEGTLAQAVYEMSQTQSQVTELLTKNENLTFQLLKLQQEFLAVKLALPTQQLVSADCPPGYSFRNDRINSCYMFVNRLLSWYDAEIFCISTRGHLVAIETEEEQNFLTQQISASTSLPGQHLWTGGNDIGSEGDWLWAGSNQPLNYTRWLSYPHSEHGNLQQPDNAAGDEHCLQLFHLQNYEWNDNPCTSKYYFICEYHLA